MDRISAVFRNIIRMLFNVRYCERCGGWIWRDGVTRCPHCDFRIRGADEKSWGLFALGLIPVVGLISGIIAAIVCSKRGKKRKAKSALLGAVLGVVMLAIVGALALAAFDVI